MRFVPHLIEENNPLVEESPQTPNNLGVNASIFTSAN